MTIKNNDLTKEAFRFVLILGIANFFADATYEGARGVIGPFLGSLGATATIIGLVSGFGELVGYTLRSLTGVFADRTRQYWLFAFLGYAVNMLAVPALALAGNWPLAAILIIAERTGRAIRKPAVEAMLSFTTKNRRGWVFGVNEALDQAGATLGPLIVALMLYLKGGYRSGFVMLLIPALLCLTTILTAWFFYRKPHEFEKEESHVSAHSLTSAYWLYVLAGALIAAGFADFSLISFHLEKHNIVSTAMIPVFYSIAMAVTAITSLVFGKLFDHLGLPIFLLAFFLGAFFAPFIFSYSVLLVLFGVFLWAISMGAQESLLKAELSKMISAKKRATAFGIFDGWYGVAWFVGSASMGWLYDHAFLVLIIFSVVIQLLALPIFVLANKGVKRRALDKS